MRGYYRPGLLNIIGDDKPPAHLEARWQHSPTIKKQGEYQFYNRCAARMTMRSPCLTGNLCEYLTDQGIPRGKTIEPLMMVVLDYITKSVGANRKLMSRCCILESHSPSHYSQAQNPLVKGKVISFGGRAVMSQVTSDSSM